jgi:hypothetical protein
MQLGDNRGPAGESTAPRISRRSDARTSARALTLPVAAGRPALGRCEASSSQRYRRPRSSSLDRRPSMDKDHRPRGARRASIRCGELRTSSRAESARVRTRHRCFGRAHSLWRGEQVSDHYGQCHVESRHHRDRARCHRRPDMPPPVRVEPIPLAMEIENVRRKATSPNNGLAA